MWGGDRRPDFEGRTHQQQNPAPAADSVRLSAEALAAAQADSSKQTAAVDSEKELEKIPTIC
jgi:hypothetical protein